jgi:hypothetical protein
MAPRYILPYPYQEESRRESLVCTVGQHNFDNWFVSSIRQARLRERIDHGETIHTGIIYIYIVTTTTKIYGIDTNHMDLIRSFHTDKCFAPRRFLRVVRCMRRLDTRDIILTLLLLPHHPYRHHLSSVNHQALHQIAPP